MELLFNKERHCGRDRGFGHAPQCPGRFSDKTPERRMPMPGPKPDVAWDRMICFSVGRLGSEVPGMRRITGKRLQSEKSHANLTEGLSSKGGTFLHARNDG